MYWGVCGSDPLGEELHLFLHQEVVMMKIFRFYWKDGSYEDLSGFSVSDAYLRKYPSTENFRKLADRRVECLGKVKS